MKPPDNFKTQTYSGAKLGFRTGRPGPAYGLQIYELINLNVERALRRRTQGGARSVRLPPVYRCSKLMKLSNFALHDRTSWPEPPTMRPVARSTRRSMDASCCLSPTLSAGPLS